MRLLSLSLEWLDPILRWLHVAAATAWLGVSLHFLLLDRDLARGRGLVWLAQHGGSLIRARRRAAIPTALPQPPTWFRWAAYATWFSGFGLLVALYYWQADRHLIDPAVLRLTRLQAAAISFGSIIIGYMIYEALCRSPLGRQGGSPWLALAGGLLLLAAAWGYGQVFSGRGALIHAGVLLGTCMVGSVAHVIIPSQRRMLSALAAGRRPDPRHAQEARQRQRHIHHLALPTVLLMVGSHHAPAHSAVWLLAGLALIGSLMLGHLLGRRRG